MKIFGIILFGIAAYFIWETGKIIRILWKEKLEDTTGIGIVFFLFLIAGILIFIGIKMLQGKVILDMF